ncbi:GNAT family N-acetyltransferase [Nonomuraea wenchangensis]
MDAFIEVARPEDVPALVRSAAALFREDGGRRDPHMDVDWPERDGSAYYDGMVTGPDTLALLVRLGGPGGPVAGHLTGQLRAPDELRPDAVVAVLVSMRVAEELRGKGVGTELVGRFLAWAQERGANEASVSAYVANTGALRFYEACGFEPHEVTLTTAVRRRSPGAGRLT